MFPCFEPRGYSPHPRHLTLASSSPAIGAQTLTCNRTGWHLDATLIPTGLKADTSHRQAQQGQALPVPLQKPPQARSVSFISQPYSGQPLPLFLSNAEIAECVAVNKLLVKQGTMSDPMQPRPPRAERTTTSCGECRRRKQKCNQGQPCNNCARRYPQPPCEYRPNSRRSSAIAGGPLQPPSQQQQPSFSISVLPPPLPPPQLPQLPPPPPLQLPLPPLGSTGHYGVEGGLPPLSPHFMPQRQHSPLASPWPRTPGEEVSGPLATWPGFDVLGQSPTTPLGAGQYAWSTDQDLFLSHLQTCEPGCTSHAPAVHEAIDRLRAYKAGGSSQSSQWGGVAGGGWGSESNAWAMAAQGMSPGISPGGNIPWGHLPGQVSPGPSHLSALPPMQDSDLFAIYINLISQFKASIDGNPDASNPYIKHFVPFCIQSSLLQRVGIYTAACFLADAGHIHRTAAMSRKSRVIELLNKHIKSQLSSSDEGILGVVQLVLNEWHWGNTVDLRAHLQGLRDMIKLRGGFRTLGLHGLITKLAITADIAIALSFETTPILQGEPEFNFRDSSHVPLRLPLNTPYMPKLASFATCDDALRIHPAVACILDDMRFLLTAVSSLPENPTAKELQKVHTTSGWIYERIMSLPAEGPTARRISAVASSAAFAAAAASPAPSSAASSIVDPEIIGGDEERLSSTSTRRRSRGNLRQSVSARRPSVQTLGGDDNRTSQSPVPISGPSGGESPDYIYQAVRLAAILYSRAIKMRRPFREIVSDAEFMQLWTTAWRVPLATWRSLLGVFNWILLPLVASAGEAPSSHARYIKGMMNISLLQVGMENWEIASGIMEGMVGLLRWLGGQVKEDDGDEEDEEDRGRRGRSGSGGGEGTGRGKGKEVMG
ncbi:hypothetical protein QBC35DRAFT_63754 [Podospora australis]|uniref:Zn(2)-C6 fungal-type domain-containing protein n=1 Tax=Podospora australis TaxID=1536484 RepID=A0AAN6WYM3_9PEZI|nr:hypothetical protein QBC35DRAFT_63754 [Podospora australis]